MITNYEEFTAELSKTKFIKRLNDDGSISFIPIDETNADYQAYLESLKK